MTRPTFKTHELKHETDCRVNDLTYRDMAGPVDCSCGAVIDWYRAVLQAVFDPENQPSQYGTVLVTRDSEAGAS